MLITRMHRTCGALLLLAAVTSVPNSTTEAFNTPSSTSSRASATVSSRTTLHGFMDAFKNDDSLAPVQNAGISGKVRDCVLVIINCTIDGCVDASLRTHYLSFSSSVRSFFGRSFLFLVCGLFPHYSSFFIFLVSRFSSTSIFFFLFLFLFHHHPAPYTYFTNTQCNVI